VNIDTLLFLGVMVVLGLFFLVVKLPLGISLPIVKHPVVTDIILSILIMSSFAAMPSVAMFSICILAVVMISLTLWQNTRHRWMERGLLRKTRRLIAECKVAMADATFEKEYNNALSLKHKLEWTEQDLLKAIREVRT